MLITQGGYAKIFHPPRNHIPKKYRDPKYIQRYTQQSQKDIELGEMTRLIFDPSSVLTRPLIAIYKQPDHHFSEILKYYDGSLEDLLDKYPDTNPELFWKAFSWMSRFFDGFIHLHKERYIHHDVRVRNILYNEHPNLKLCFIDWATSVPYNKVYDLAYKNWHEGQNENFPPEYKAYAHYKYGKSINDVVREFSRNQYFHFILKVDPKYPSKLRKAFRFMQKRLNMSHDSYDLMTNIADKVDVFALGIVILAMFATWISKDPLQKQIVFLIQNMLNPNPFTRWNIKKVSKFARLLVDAHDKNTVLRTSFTNTSRPQPKSS